MLGAVGNPYLVFDELASALNDKDAFGFKLLDPAQCFGRAGNAE